MQAYYNGVRSIMARSARSVTAVRMLGLAAAAVSVGVAQLFAVSSHLPPTCATRWAAQ